MLSLVYRDTLPQAVGDEFDSLVAQLQGFLSVGHNEDGTLKTSALSTSYVPGYAPPPVSTRPWIWLGGSAVEYVQSPGPGWIPSDGTLADPGLTISINTVTRGSLDGVVTARLRATSGSVRARLFNVTDGISVGSSFDVSSAVYQTVVFAVVLTPGTRDYRLELLPSLANVDVGASAYLE